ncbi:DUF4136 domain-containing protein [Pontibacter vulgaris]|uniref:DUF4136 domain-containing protein n=1 Tax=Pontibacter vulgaris TaxID=2905679 RepID=UPI001FA72580|nr:DUF4136 domain-containing protein [Pontibacter vulgaris]
MGASLKRHGIGAIYTLLFLLNLISCAPGSDVQASFDRATDFQRFRTFGWYQATPAANIQSGQATYSTDIDKRLRLAIESELVKKGLAPATSDPDLLLAYDLNIGQPAQDIPADAFAPGFGYGYSYWYGYRYNYDTSRLPDYRTVAAYPKGTLIIDLIDPDTNQLVWRGWVTDGITETKADSREINRAVASILSGYPVGTAAR